MKKILSYIRKVILLLKNIDNRPRCRMIDLAMDFCRHNTLSGNYFEFGVFEGKTFQYAYHSAQERDLKKIKFFALDSFEGFSKPEGHDDIGHVAQGGRFCSEDKFLNNLKKWGVNLRKVKTVKGFFSETLLGDGKINTLNKIQKSKVAIAYVDCDLYEPTIETLNFITEYLEDGSVLIFDNWFLFKGNPGRGERRAFYEWSKNNPNIIITPFHNFGWHGTSFIINMPIE